MRKAVGTSIAVTTFFYITIGVFGCARGGAGLRVGTIGGRRARASGGPGELTCGGAPQVRRVRQQQPRHARQPALRRRLHRPLVRPRAARAARAARPGALPAALHCSRAG